MSIIPAVSVAAAKLGMRAIRCSMIWNACDIWMIASYNLGTSGSGGAAIADSNQYQRSLLKDTARDSGDEMVKDKESSTFNVQPLSGSDLAEV